MRNHIILACLLLGGGVLNGADNPSATISNQQLKVKVYLPDTDNGFYKGARFEWGGIIGGVEYAGHTFYSPWFTQFDPAVRDFSYKDNDIVVGLASSAMGPAEEFQTPLGYDTAKQGDTFVKIGVGILKKREDTRYTFSNPYDIVDHGKWTVRKAADSLTFTQELTDPISGYGYVYTKTIRLTNNKPEMVIEHSLKNTGKLPLKSLLYDHNFTNFDHLPTGDITVTVPYDISAGARPPDPRVVQITGKQFAYVKTLENQERATGGLQGFGTAATDYDFRIENRKAGTGVRIQGDRPLQNASVWSIRSVMAVEPFIQIAADPGQDFTWKYTYTYYTLPK